MISVYNGEMLTGNSQYIKWRCKLDHIYFGPFFFITFFASLVEKVTCIMNRILTSLTRVNYLSAPNTGKKVSTVRRYYSSSSKKIDMSFQTPTPYMLKVNGKVNSVNGVNVSTSSIVNNTWYVPHILFFILAYRFAEGLMNHPSL